MYKWFQDLDDKNKNLAKLQTEMKTISMAAKQGIEAATKVKELETDNKKLSEENVVLTKNFESERVGVISCSKELLQCFCYLQYWFSQ